MDRSTWILDTIARVTAFCLGTFTTLNVLGTLRFGVDANLWWVDLRGLPPGLRLLGYTLFAGAVLAYGLRPPRAGWRRTVTVWLVGLFLLVCLRDAVQVLTLRADDRVPGPWFSMSMAAAAALGLIFVRALRQPAPAPRFGRPIVALASFCLLLLAFPLGQMSLFGHSDYRRPADAVVVFGSRVYADGQLSDALADRMRTGVELVRGGWAPLLIVSGGPGDGQVHETEAMRAFAEARGIPAEAILEDRNGWSTLDSVRGTTALRESKGLDSLIAVSHAYHLPRIELCYHWEGMDAATVPARESYRLSAMPKYMAREVAAFWAYWGRGILGV